MRQALDLIITFALIFFAVGLGILCKQMPESMIGLLWLPLIILYIFLGRSHSPKILKYANAKFDQSGILSDKIQSVQVPRRAT
jgi:hypothetical protein